MLDKLLNIFMKNPYAWIFAGLLVIFIYANLKTSNDLEIVCDDYLNLCDKSEQIYSHCKQYTLRYPSGERLKRGLDICRR